MALTPKEIAQSHEIDDLCRIVSSLKRNSADAQALLETCAAALANGDLDVAAEHLDRARTYLTR